LVSFKTGCDTYPKRTLCAETGRSAPLPVFDLKRRA
jgi:hypothetical protein